MYILPTPTHLEVVALGDSSNISPDQHLNYALIPGLPKLQVGTAGGAMAGPISG